MQRGLKLLKKTIINSDMFGQPLRIYLDKNHKYRSIFGGVLSLFIIIFLFILGLNQFLALFYKTSLKVLENTTYLSDPGPLELKKNGFMFAFGFPNKYIKEYGDKLFEFKVYYIHQKRNIITNSLDRNTIEVKTEFCTEKHFPNHTKEFKQINLNNYLCPSLNDSNFILHGGFHNENFKFVQIAINRCDATKNNCLNDTILQKLFSTTFFFEFYIVNNDIRIENHLNPIEQYLKSDIHFLINPLTNLYKMADIFLSELEINDRFNPFVLSKNDKNTSTYIFKEEKREQTNLYTIPPSTIADFFFRKSYYKYTFTKTYGDAFSILSYLGGLCGSLVVIFGYFASKYNDHSYLLKMSNFLFSFPEETKKNKKDDEDEKNGNKNETNITDENFFDKFRKIKTCELNIAQRLHEKDSTTTMTSYLLQKVTSYLDSLKPLKPSIKDICTVLPFGKKYAIRKEKIKKAKKAAQENLNLGTILLKMQELERLKKILLTEEQNKVFSFFPKPNIFFDEKNKCEEFELNKEFNSLKSVSTKKLDNYYTFAELFGFVSDLQNSEENNMFKKEINEKLVNLILNEVRELINFTLNDIKINLLNENRKMSVLMSSFAENLSPKKKSIGKKPDFMLKEEEKKMEEIEEENNTDDFFELGKKNSENLPEIDDEFFDIEEKNSQNLPELDKKI